MSGSRKKRPMRPFLLLSLLAALAFTAGCSTSNPGGESHIDASGQSVAGWVVVPTGGTHSGAATQEYIAGNGSFSCAQCHGADLSGGISAASCFGNPAGCHHGPVPNWSTPAVHGAAAKKAPGSSGFVSCQICHGNNFSGGGAGVACEDCHGIPAPHPFRPWRGSPYTHATTNTANAPVCAGCHYPGSPNNPAGHPATPAAPGTPPGCFNNTLCHGENPVSHPVPYNADSHYSVTSATFPGSCSACHDVSTPSVGPACQTCHVAASPLTAASCTSCHASPPNSGAPAGAAYPNIVGAHATHIALNNAGNPVSCDTCHNGLGPSLLNLNHYNRAKSRVAPGDVLFLATYNAQSGPSSFDNTAALSCSNVSCHGGQATPNWQTGTLNVNTQCTSCHVFGTSLGNPQYNSPYSGQHNLNLSHRTCTYCHNTTTLAPNHFTTLSTTTMEGPASATIGGTGTLIPAGGYNSATRSCSPNCHGTETW